MKIDLRIEKDGSPILFFPDAAARDKSIGCYAHTWQHSTAPRAYMRQCRKPASGEDIARCLRLLREWACLPY